MTAVKWIIVIAGAVVLAGLGGWHWGLFDRKSWRLFTRHSTRHAAARGAPLDDDAPAPGDDPPPPPDVDPDDSDTWVYEDADHRAKVEAAFSEPATEVYTFMPSPILNGGWTPEDVPRPAAYSPWAGPGHHNSRPGVLPPVVDAVTSLAAPACPDSDPGPGRTGCPNTPPCPHPGLVHDIQDWEDDLPRCCVDGCDCGKRDSTDVTGPEGLAEPRVAVAPGPGHPELFAVPVTLQPHSRDECPGDCARHARQIPDWVIADPACFDGFTDSGLLVDYLAMKARAAA